MEKGTKGRIHIRIVCELIVKLGKTLCAYALSLSHTRSLSFWRPLHATTTRTLNSRFTPSVTFNCELSVCVYFARHNTINGCAFALSSCRRPKMCTMCNATVPQNVKHIETMWHVLKFSMNEIISNVIANNLSTEFNVFDVRMYTLHIHISRLRSDSFIVVSAFQMNWILFGSGKRDRDRRHRRRMTQNDMTIFIHRFIIFVPGLWSINCYWLVASWCSMKNFSIVRVRDERAHSVENFSFVLLQCKLARNTRTVCAMIINNLLQFCSTAPSNEINQFNYVHSSTYVYCAQTTRDIVRMW